MTRRLHTHHAEIRADAEAECAETKQSEGDRGLHGALSECVPRSITHRIQRCHAPARMTGRFEVRMSSAA